MNKKSIRVRKKTQNKHFRLSDIGLFHKNIEKLIAKEESENVFSEA